MRKYMEGDEKRLHDESRGRNQKKTWTCTDNVCTETEQPLEDERERWFYERHKMEVKRVNRKTIRESDQKRL
jgi:hypothetical protein